MKAPCNRPKGSNVNEGLSFSKSKSITCGRTSTLTCPTEGKYACQRSDLEIAIRSYSGRSPTVPIPFAGLGPVSDRARLFSSTAVRTLSLSIRGLTCAEYAAAASFERANVALGRLVSRETDPS